MSIFDFLGNDPRTLFLKFSPDSSNWRVVSWNFDLKNSSDRQWVLEVFKPEQESIQWSRGSVESVQFFKNKRLARKRRIPEDKKDFRDLMNLCIHSTLKLSLDSNHEFLLTPVSGVTTADYQNEAKALLWIQASFGTLMKSLDKVKDQPELILTAAVFSGTEPESG